MKGQCVEVLRVSLGAVEAYPFRKKGALQRSQIG